MIKNITSDIKYVGVDDLDLDLFESQYIIPNGISYNSYIIEDEQIAIMDSPASVTSGSQISQRCLVSANPIFWLCSTWSPTMPVASQRLWSVTPR